MALVVAVVAGAFWGILSPWFFTSRPITDVGIVANGGARVAAGQAPYRDFFLFVGPLSPVLTGAWYRAFGESAFSIIGLAVLVGALMATAAYWLARSLAPAGFAALAALSTLPLGPLFWLTLSHHWFATLFLTAGTAATVRGLQLGRARWVFLAGALVALGSLAHQSRGGLMLVAQAASILVAWRPGPWRRGVLALAAGSALVAVPSVLLLLASAGPGATAYGLVVFALEEYPKANRVPYLAFDLMPTGLLASPPWLPPLQGLLAYVGLLLGPIGPVLLALLVVRARRAHRRRDTAGLAAASAMGVAAWAGILYHPSAVHVSYAVPWFAAAWAAVASIVAAEGRGSARRGVRLAVAATCAAGLVFVPLPQAWAIMTGAIVSVQVPSGPVPLGMAADAAQFGASFPEVAAFVTRHSVPGDPVLFYPFRSVGNVLLRRPNPAELDQIAPGENTSEQVRRAIASVTDRAGSRLVVIEKSQAERVARVDRDQRGVDGAWAVATLRATLPLLLETDRVEIRGFPAVDQTDEARRAAP